MDRSQQASAIAWVGIDNPAIVGMSTEDILHCLGRQGFVPIATRDSILIVAPKPTEPREVELPEKITALVVLEEFQIGKESPEMLVWGLTPLNSNAGSRPYLGASGRRRRYNKF